MKNPLKNPSWQGTALLLTALFAFWLSTVSCTHAGDAPKAADPDQAFAWVKNRIEAGSFRNYDVFIANQPFQGGSLIPTRGTNIKVPSNYDLAWFLFVDDQPQANWGHACRYFFVSVETGHFAVVPAKTPPDSWSEMKKIYSSGKRP